MEAMIMSDKNKETKGMEITIRDPHILELFQCHVYEVVDKVLTDNKELRDELFNTIVDKTVAYYTNYKNNEYVISEVIRKAMFKFLVDGARITDKKFVDHVQKLGIRLDRLTEDDTIALYLEYHVKALVEEILVDKVKKFFNQSPS